MTNNEPEAVRVAREVLECAKSWHYDARILGNVRAIDITDMCNHIVDQHERRAKARDIANRAGVSCYADVSDEYMRLTVQQAERIDALEAEVRRVRDHEQRERAREGMDEAVRDAARIVAEFPDSTENAERFARALIAAHERIGELEAEVGRLQHAVGTERCAEELLAKLRLERSAAHAAEDALASARAEVEALRGALGEACEALEGYCTDELTIRLRLLATKGTP